VAIRRDTILAVGPSAAILAAHAGPATRVIDAAGRVVTPGLVDAHTHLVFAGTREHEYEQRLQGADYWPSWRRAAVSCPPWRATRAAAVPDLAAGLRARLARMLAHGTTSVEVKSGYGLSTPAELHSLQAIHLLATEPDARLPRLAPTFLGAHAVPPEYADRADAYVDLLIDETLPRSWPPNWPSRAMCSATPGLSPPIRPAACSPPPRPSGCRCASTPTSSPRSAPRPWPPNWRPSPPTTCSCSTRPRSPPWPRPASSPSCCPAPASVSAALRPPAT
jgi:hypothetical protein